VWFLRLMKISTPIHSQEMRRLIDSCQASISFPISLPVGLNLPTVIDGEGLKLPNGVEYFSNVTAPIGLAREQTERAVYIPINGHLLSVAELRSLASRRFGSQAGKCLAIRQSEIKTELGEANIPFRFAPLSPQSF